MTDTTLAQRLIGAACNLSEEDLRRRVAEWRALRGRSTTVTPISGGIALALHPDEEIAAVADLMSREADCCPFYTFTIRVDGEQRTLEITAGPGGELAVQGLLGLPA